MTKKEIKSLTNSELIYRLVINERRACKEINSKRGLTKKNCKRKRVASFGMQGTRTVDRGRYTEDT